MHGKWRSVREMVMKAQGEDYIGTAGNSALNLGSTGRIKGSGTEVKSERSLKVSVGLKSSGGRLWYWKGQISWVILQVRVRM